MGTWKSSTKLICLSIHEHKTYLPRHLSCRTRQALDYITHNFWRDPQFEQSCEMNNILCCTLQSSWRYLLRTMSILPNTMCAFPKGLTHVLIHQCTNCPHVLYTCRYIFCLFYLFMIYIYTRIYYI